MVDLPLFIACAPGLEPLLAAELAALGAASPREEAGGVSVLADPRLFHRIHLEVGLGLRVQVTLAAERVAHLSALATLAARLPWERYLPAGRPVAIHATSRRSRIYHTGAIVERVAAGVARRLGALPDAPVAASEPTAVHVRFDADRCALSVDTSGPLHRRGYRLATAKAPLREDLARAALIASGWDRQSPLVDPFCGAGTIAIEAALLARRLPPGAGRHAPFMDGPLFSPALWAEVTAAAAAAAAPTAPPISGSDRDAGAIAAARDNAARAGVLADVAFAEAALGAAPGLAGPHDGAAGAVVTNPPWGRRVGGKRPLRPLYQSLGARLRALPPGWRVGLVVADPALARDVDPALRSALMTDHGGVKVFLMTGATRGR